VSRAETGHNKQTGKAALLQVGTYNGLITGIDCLCRDKGLKWDECDCRMYVMALRTLENTVGSVSTELRHFRPCSLYLNRSKCKINDELVMSFCDSVYQHLVALCINYCLVS